MARKILIMERNNEVIRTVPTEKLEEIEEQAIDTLNADAWILAREELLRRRIGSFAIG